MEKLGQYFWAPKWIENDPKLRNLVVHLNSTVRQLTCPPQVLDGSPCTFSSQWPFPLSPSCWGRTAQRGHHVYRQWFWGQKKLVPSAVVKMEQTYLSPGEALPWQARQHLRPRHCRELSQSFFNRHHERLDKLFNFHPLYSLFFTQTWPDTFSFGRPLLRPNSQVMHKLVFNDWF